MAKKRLSRVKPIPIIQRIVAFSRWSDWSEIPNSLWSAWIELATPSTRALISALNSLRSARIAVVRWRGGSVVAIVSGIVGRRLRGGVRAALVVC